MRIFTASDDHPLSRIAPSVPMISAKLISLFESIERCSPTTLTMPFDLGIGHIRPSPLNLVVTHQNTMIRNMVFKASSSYMFTVPSDIHKNVLTTVHLQAKVLGYLEASPSPEVGTRGSLRKWPRYRSLTALQCTFVCVTEVSPPVSCAFSVVYIQLCARPPPGGRPLHCATHFYMPRW